MDKNVGEINSIEFGILSADDILAMSVVEVNSSKLVGPNSIYDEKMGKSTDLGNCESCGLTVKNCPGHFGHINLARPILHPLFQKTIMSYLKCMCLDCKKLLIDDETLRLHNITKYKNESRFKKILEYTDKINICKHCIKIIPKITYSKDDDVINATYLLDKKEKKVETLTVEKIKDLFDSISDDNAYLFGIDPQMVHPKNLILTVLPVLPPACRPCLSVDGNMSDDDLTNQYNEIIKLNNNLYDLLSKTEQKQDSRYDAKYIKLMQSLKFRISTLFNNSHKKSKHQTNNRPIRGLKERISGKDGLIRDNLMGKETVKACFNLACPKQVDAFKVEENTLKGKHCKFPPCERYNYLVDNVSATFPNCWKFSQVYSTTCMW